MIFVTKRYITFNYLVMLGQLMSKHTCFSVTLTTQIISELVKTMSDNQQALVYMNMFKETDNYNNVYSFTLITLLHVLFDR